MSKKNVLDSLLDALTTNHDNAASLVPVQKSSLSDKIPARHSDLIITMILNNSNELFSDNRKRKPIFNARRKQKWTELVENLNQTLDVDYSVERVKNNYHYRVTSIKRNISRILGSLGPNEDVTECDAFQQLSEIDKLLYNAIKSTCTDGEEVTTKRKKAKIEQSADKQESNYPSMVSSPNFFSTEDLLLNNHCLGTPSASNLEENPSADVFEENVNEPTLKVAVTQVIRAQAETLETMKEFMRSQLLQQAKVLELINSTTEVLRESAANIARFTNPPPCPNCTTDNFLEAFLQACNNNNPKLLNNLVSKKNNQR